MRAAEAMGGPEARIVAALRSLRDRFSRGGFPFVAGIAAGALVAGLTIPAVQGSEVRAVASGEERSPAAGAGSSSPEGSARDTTAEAPQEGGATAGPAAGTGAGGGTDRTDGGGSPGTGGGGEDDGGGGGDSPGDGPSDDVRGVTGELITIGVALPDIEAFGAVSEEFDIGDAQEQMEAILDGWRRQGRVPVHGRDIEFVYRRFSILSSDEKIAACNGFIKDDEVFAVIAGRFFGEGAECVAERFDTPLITINSTDESTYERAAPYYFTVRSSWERVFRNWVAWADRDGHFEDRTIGLFYEEAMDGSIDAAREEMERRGYAFEEEVAASGSGIGSSQDQVAVQRFRQAGVDLAVLVVGGTSAINFMTFAEQQGYRPDYLAMDYGEHTTDAAASAFPPEQYDGTFAVSSTRVGEIAAGFELPEATRYCVSNYERYSGKEIGHESPESAEYNNILMSCDLAEPMLAGLEQTGAELDFTTFVRGLEAVRGLRLAGHGDLALGEGRHQGVASGRSIRWTRDCGCWTAVDPEFTAFSR